MKLYFLIAFFFMTSAFAQQAQVLTSITRFANKPKYPENFKYFPYVNVNASKGGKIRLSTVGTFSNLNPYIIKGAFPEGIQICYEGMMRRAPDEPFTLYALIAEKVELPENRSFIIFHINPKAKFQDGTLITSKDVKVSYETLRDSGLPRYKHYFSKVENIEIINSLTVKVSFKKNAQNCYDMELPMIIAMVPIFSSKQLKQIDFANSGLEVLQGSGPYFISKVEQGRYVTMSRNKDYWGKDLPMNRGCFNYNEIRIDMYKNAQAQLQAFFTGEFDMIFETNPNQWETAYHSAHAIKDGRIIKTLTKHNKQVAARTIIMNMNSKDKSKKDIFSNFNIRKALVLAFDFSSINRLIFNNVMMQTNSLFSNTYLAHYGKAKGKELEILSKFRKKMGETFFNAITSNPFTPPSVKSNEERRKNLEEADKLLRKEGWFVKDGKRINTKGEVLQLELMIKDPRFEKIALFYRDSLKKLGIYLAVRLMDSVQYENRVTERNFDMIIHTWANSLCPGNEQTYYFSEEMADQEGSSNYIGLKDAIAEELAKLVASAQSIEEHTAAAHALDRYVMHQCYQIPLNYDPYLRYAYWKKLVEHPNIDPDVGLNILSYGWAINN